MDIDINIFFYFLLLFFFFFSFVHNTSAKRVKKLLNRRIVGCLYSAIIEGLNRAITISCDALF